MPKNKPREEKKPIGERISALLARTIRFVTYDIWRITENEVSGLKEIYINIIKTVILAVRGFQSENLQTKASALTYSTLLSIVPLLAVLLGIAKGFGFQGTVRQELFDYFPGHEMELNKAFEFVESYLAQAQGGVIIGVGLILLFYTVINLISSVEDTFNDIWQIQKSRPWYRKISDYLAFNSQSYFTSHFRLSGLIPRAAGADDGIQRFVHLHVYLAELVLGAILIFYAAHGVVLAYSALYYHDIGFHGAVRLPAEYESEVRERVGGRLYRWLRLPVVPIYLYQRADLGEQVQRYLR